MNQAIRKIIEDINNGIVPEGYKQTPFGIFPCDWETDKKLNDLGTFDKGKGLPGDKMCEDGVPCIGYGDIYMKYNYHFEKAQNFVDEVTASESQPIEKGTLLFTGTGETAEEIGKCVCYNGDETIYAGGDIILFNSKDVNPLFLAYQQYQDFSLKKKATYGQGHSVVHIQRGELGKLHTAFPKDKTEQSKIAEILMKWDEMVELQEQYILKLELRKKAIMKKLLTPKDGWLRIRMNEVGKLYQPVTISDNQLKEEGYIVYGANGTIGFYDKYNHEDEEIAITCRGSTCGTVTLTKPKSWITGNAMVFQVVKKFCKRFFYYLCLDRNFQDIISGSGQPQITRQAFNKVFLNVPSTIEEQQKISTVLEKLDEEISLQKEKLEKIKIQRKAIQQYLLTGIVRVS